MAPAADHRANTESMADTFYLTNMCPQCPQFNRGYWKKLEKYVRDLTKSYTHVHG
jgi:endonuclease G, mitochondrial